MRIALDTNILAYAEGVGDAVRCESAVQLIEQLPTELVLLIMAVAAENHCRLLITEDMQDGFTWRGLTIVNPFSKPCSALLEKILSKN